MIALDPVCPYLQQQILYGYAVMVMNQDIRQQSKPEILEEIVFSQETIQALTELGLVLERIYRRMKSEGYDIINDRIIHLATGEEYDPNKQTIK